MEIKRILVVGAGTMGNGIAQTAAVAGYQTTMTDIDPKAIDRAMSTIGRSVDKLAVKGVITEEQKAAALSLASSADLEPARQADLVIEAATENPAVKLQLFADLDRLAPGHAVLASNTSSIPLTKIGSATGRPEKVIGMHFFNPVAMMALVELIRGLQTSQETYAAVEAVAKKIGKHPVQVRNSPGFVVNRMLCPMINEAAFALAEGLATAEQIDEAMKLGANHPIGPLALCDLIGLDVELAVMQVLFEGFKDPKYRPAPLLVEMVEAGYLGRKSGRGFFSYDK